MSLLSLPAGVRLQIWNRHLALRGRPNICHGDTRPHRAAASTWSRHHAFSGSAQRGQQDEEFKSSVSQSIQQDMFSRILHQTPPVETYTTNDDNERHEAMMSLHASLRQSVLEESRPSENGPLSEHASDSTIARSQEPHFRETDSSRELLYKKEQLKQSISDARNAASGKTAETRNTVERSKDGRSQGRFLSKVQAVRTGRRAPKTMNVFGFGRQRLVPSQMQAPTELGRRREVIGAHQPKIGSYPEGAEINDGPFDLTYLIEKIGMVTADQYPHAPMELFSPTNVETVIRQACKQQLKITVDRFQKQAYRTSDGKKGYEFTATIPSLITLSAIGEADDDPTARRVALAHLLAKLHAKDILRTLFPVPSDQTAPINENSLGLDAKPGNTADAAVPPEAPSASESEELFNSLVSPLKNDYGHASEGLFAPESIAMTVHQAFQQSKIPYVVDGKTESRHLDGVTLVAYRLQVELPSGGLKRTSGEARNKVVARQIAWAHMLRELSDSGFLIRLFPKSAEQSEHLSADPTSSPDETVERDIDEDELVTVDTQTMEAEKDATVEIYNWAASFGLIPRFQARIVKKRRPGTRHQPKESSSTFVEVSIKLPGLGLHTFRVGTTLQMAETAAAMAFKEAAEAKQRAGSIRASDSNWSAVNVETAKSFFDFYRSRNKDVYLEVDANQCSVARVTQNSAQITLNDRAIGERVVMRRKTDAEQVARLTAAIELLKEQPQLLEEFAAEIRKNSGKVLRDLRPTKVSVNGRTLDVMRNGLVEARNAGLSDVRQSLFADPIASEEGRTGRRPLSDVLRGKISAALHRRRLEAGATTGADTEVSLPMSQYRKQVIDLVDGSLYSIIIGATGSGKTTQVPQIILDHAIERRKGGFCDIVCTQPRRLAAISVASRVAAERNQAVGDHVGYHVRFDHKGAKMGASITYCTTGILLEQLKYDAEGIFDTVSHIVIDEVHERNLPIDFLMVFLKRAIRERQAAGKSVPKVILMSATLDPHLFADYFGEDCGEHKTPAPILKVPGRTFPVQEKYVEEIIADFSSEERTELDAMAGLEKGATKDYLSRELAMVNQSTTTTVPVIDWKREFNEDQSDEDKALAREKDDAVVPLALVIATVAHICKKDEEGAILVFLPGFPEIVSVQNMLQNRAFGLAFDDPDKFKICPLHSALPPHEQTDVLEPVPEGCRKIILSTTIAETSVTVPDVKFVVDSGKLRQKRYDQNRRITQLITTWESSSNARQRAGRAGRVRAGNYYALFTHWRRRAMAASALPELLLSDLQEVCLSVKAQGFSDSVQSFLGQAIEPPSETAVLGAIENLKAIEALTQDEELTALGRTLSRLPVHPSLGKMILLGIVFRCLDPILVLSSLDKDRSLFISPPGRREETKRILSKYHKHDSDQLAFYEAFKELRALRSQFGASRAEAHARQNSLHMGTFRSIAATAESIEKILIECKLVPNTASVIRENQQYGGIALNRYSDNPALIKALFLAGVQPNLAAKFQGKSRMHRTSCEEKVMIHPSSLNYMRGKPPEEGDFIYAYESLRKTIQGDVMFIKDISRATPLQVLLFGGKLQAEGSRMRMDDWLPFRIESLEDPRFATRLVLEFRKALDRMLNGAFNSLSDVQEGVTIADDPIREGFVKAVVAVLDEGEHKEKRTDSGLWVPQGWRKHSVT